MNLFLSQTEPATTGKATEATATAAKEGVAKLLEMIKSGDIPGLTDMGLEFLLKVGPKIIFALLFLWIGFQIARLVGKIAKKGMGKAKVDESLASFLSNVFTFVLKVFVLVTSASIIGIPVTSFVAILGAAGLAIGLALKDGLGNFAGGVVLLLFKPIKLGDLITVAGHHGWVKSISIFYTILETKNNQTVTIPNGTVSNGEVINFSTSPLVRVQALVGIGYGDDIKKAREIMLAQTLKDDRIVRDPEPFVVLKELGDNSVNLELRCWAEPKPYRRVLFGLLENIKESFDANGISIPYPQRDVHVIKENNGSDPASISPEFLAAPVAEARVQPEPAPVTASPTPRPVAPAPAQVSTPAPTPQQQVPRDPNLGIPPQRTPGSDNIG